jgi:hypothetical protein
MLQDWTSIVSERLRSRQAEAEVREAEAEPGYFIEQPVLEDPGDSLTLEGVQMIFEHDARERGAEAAVNAQMAEAQQLSLAIACRATAEDAEMIADAQQRSIVTNNEEYGYHNTTNEGGGFNSYGYIRAPNADSVSGQYDAQDAPDGWGSEPAPMRPYSPAQGMPTPTPMPPRPYSPTPAPPGERRGPIDNGFLAHSVRRTVRAAERPRLLVRGS